MQVLLYCSFSYSYPPFFQRHFNVRPVRCTLTGGGHSASNRQHPGRTSPPLPPSRPPFTPCWHPCIVCRVFWCCSDVFLRLFTTSESRRRKTSWGTWCSICVFFFQKLMHHSHEDYAMHMSLRKFALRWEFKEIRVSTISSNFTRNCLLEASIFCPVAREDLHRKLPWYEQYTPCGRYRGGCLATAIFYAFTPLLRIYSSLSISLPRHLFLCLPRLPGQFQTF